MTKKFSKNLKFLKKLGSFFVNMMAIASNYNLKETSTNSHKSPFKTNQTKSSKNNLKKRENLPHFEPKNTLKMTF